MEGTWERLEEGKRRGNDVSKRKHLDLKPKNRLALILCGKTAGHMRKNSILTVQCYRPTALGRTSPEPHPGNTAEPTLWVWVHVNWP